MTENEPVKHRALIFFTYAGEYVVYTDPGVEVYVGHEECLEYILYKDKPIDDENFLGEEFIICPPPADGKLDVVNNLILRNLDRQQP